MRQSAVSPEEWIRHRKLRKKIASAKWYAHKKQREIDDQREHRKRLATELLVPLSAYTWDERSRAEWFGVVAHHSWGYPSRRDDENPIQWRRWVEEVERDIVRLTEGAADVDGTWGLRMHDTFVRKIFRQLAIRELRTPPPDRVAFRRIVLPKGYVHPYDRQPPRLWTTSVWNWLWVVTHLGNHREDFDVVWNHLHHSRIHPPDAEGWALLRHDSHCRHWLCWMSQNLSDHLRPEPETNEPVSEPDPDSDEEGYHTSPDRYATQFNTPDWYLPTSDDSDSESLPSSLDQFVTEAFASESQHPPFDPWPPSASINSKNASSSPDVPH